MYEILITYGKGKDFQRINVEKVIYTPASGEEVEVSGEALLTHHFPISSVLIDMQVVTSDGSSTVSCKDIRSISIFDQDDL